MKLNVIKPRPWTPAKIAAALRMYADALEENEKFRALIREQEEVSMSPEERGALRRDIIMGRKKPSGESAEFIRQWKQIRDAFKGTVKEILASLTRAEQWQVLHRVMGVSILPMYNYQMPTGAPSQSRSLRKMARLISSAAFKKKYAAEDLKMVRNSNNPLGREHYLRQRAAEKAERALERKKKK